MIGKPVPKEEFRKLFAEEKRKDELISELYKELKVLKPGECLVYETKEGTESALSLVLSFSPIKNLKLIDRPGKVYAYKER